MVRNLRTPETDIFGLCTVAGIYIGSGHPTPKVAGNEEA